MVVRGDCPVVLRARACWTLLAATTFDQRCEHRSCVLPAIRVRVKECHAYREAEVHERDRRRDGEDDRSDCFDHASGPV